MQPATMDSMDGHYDDAIYPEIARRMRALRAMATGTSHGCRAEFCELTGIKRNTWSAIEHGHIRPGDDTLEKLRTTLFPYLSTDWVLHGIENAMPLGVLQSLAKADEEVHKIDGSSL